MKVAIGGQAVIETKPFSFAEFFSEDYRFDPNEPRIVVTEMNLADVRAVSMLREGEHHITGEESLYRLKEGNHIRLGVDALMFFWENQQFIPKEWEKHDTVHFVGDIILCPGSENHRHTLCLARREIKWYVRIGWLGYNKDVSDRSAILVRP